jgi:hypothetical protein
MPNALRSINDLTLEKSRMYVNTVGKSLLIPVFFCAMKGRTLGRDPTFVNYVEKPLIV